MEAISGRKTVQEIAAYHSIRPIQVSQWKRQLLDGANELFTRGKKTKDKQEGQAKEAELFQQIGRPQIELEWLNKGLSFFDAHELRRTVAHDHPELSATERDLAAENRSLEVFIGGLQSLWQSNQPRRHKPKPRTGKRTWPDPCAPDVERIEQWLQAEPQVNAKTLLARLIDLHPQRYGERNLRTLQRRLRGYRLQWIEREMAAVATAPIPGMQRSETGGMPVLSDVNQNC